MYLGNREFDTQHHTYVMGILNLTPDSFSDGGRYQRMDRALYRAQEMIAEGADILDLGGESTRPGHESVPEAEEMERVLPVLERLHERFEIPLSLDTSKSRVAAEGIAAGASLINDVWGLQKEGMSRVIAESGVCCCLMHNRTKITEDLTLDGFVAQMEDDLHRALEAGIKREQLILDPGIGFAKTQPYAVRLPDPSWRFTQIRDRPCAGSAGRKAPGRHARRHCGGGQVPLRFCPRA